MPAVLRVAGRVTLRARRQHRLSRGSSSGDVEVTLADGRVLRERQDRPRGGPDAPLTREELEAKFRGNAGLALPPERVERVIRAVHALAARRDRWPTCSRPSPPERTMTMTVRFVDDLDVAAARPRGLLCLGARAAAASPRTRALEAAKKEGKVVWYTSLALPSAEKVAKLFEAAYPGIKVEVHRTGLAAHPRSASCRSCRPTSRTWTSSTPPTPATSCSSRRRSS